jgi:hypothetical protein
MNQLEQIRNELLDVEAIAQTLLTRFTRIRAVLLEEQSPKKSKSAAKIRATQLELTVFKNMRKNMAA